MFTLGGGFGGGFVVTHDSPVARRAQRIGVMRNGKLSIKQDTRPARAT